MFCFRVCCDFSKPEGGEDTAPLIKYNNLAEEEDEEEDRELLSDDKEWPDSK